METTLTPKAHYLVKTVLYLLSLHDDLNSLLDREKSNVCVSLLIGLRLSEAVKGEEKYIDEATNYIEKFFQVLEKD